MKKKILITGFEPFDQDSRNLSGEWVNSKIQHHYHDRSVKTLILPVVFRQCFLNFKKVFDEFDPDIVLMTGIANNREQLTVERIGINWMDARIPDNSGSRPLNMKIDDEAPDGLFTTIEPSDLQKICPELKVSTSAGEYVCNDLLFEVLTYLKTSGHRARATFIHLPGKMPEEQIIKNLDNILENI